MLNTHKRQHYRAMPQMVSNRTISPGRRTGFHGIAVSIVHPANIVSEMWGDQLDEGRHEGLMAAADVARLAVPIASLPPTTNLLESTMLPFSMPFLGRG
jgi:hypothetical protein